MLRQTDVAPEEWRAMFKPQILDAILSDLPADLIVVETGRVRGLIPNEGHSTCRFALHPHVKRLYSIDNDSRTEVLAKLLLPEECRFCPQDSEPKIVFVTMDSHEGLNLLNARLLPGTVDLLFLDSVNEPKHILREFESAEPLLKDRAVIIVDDVYNGGLKGDLLIPKLKDEGHKISAWRDFAIVEYERKK